MWLFIALPLLVLVAFLTVRAIHLDGYGQRPPPPSHPDPFPAGHGSTERAR